MLRGAVKKGLPYRGKLRWGKVTKFLLGKENFPWWNFSPTSIMALSNFPGKSDKTSLFSPSIDVLFNALIKGEP